MIINGEEISDFIPCKILKTSQAMYSISSNGLWHKSARTVAELEKWVVSQNSVAGVVRPFKIVHIDKD